MVHTVNFHGSFSGAPLFRFYTLNIYPDTFHIKIALGQFCKQKLVFLEISELHHFCHSDQVLRKRIIKKTKSV